MNLFALLNRGCAHAPTDAQRKRAEVVAAAEKARQQWLDALLVDQTRAWMNIGEYEPGVLAAMATMLTIAGFAHVYDCKRTDTVDLRIIRGAISAATQCMAAGGRVTVADAQAFSSAAMRAEVIIKAASVDGIVHASQAIRDTVGI